MLKRCLLALVLAGLVYAVPTSALAQNNGGNDQQSPPAVAPPNHRHGRGQFDPAKRAKMLTRKLQLTSDQQPKIEDILKSEQSQKESLRSDSSVSPADRRSKMMGIRKASNDQIRALLDPNQQKKWDAIQSRREHRRQGHRQEGQAPGAVPDASEQK